MNTSIKPLCIALVFLGSSFVFAQEHKLDLLLTIVDDSTEVPIKGVTISIKKNGKDTLSVQTNEKGKVEIVGLPMLNNYWISISKEGYATKCMEIDTHTENEDDLPITYEQPAEAGLFPIDKKWRYRFLKKEAVISFSLDENGLLMWDRKSLKRMQKKIDLVHNDGLRHRQADRYMGQIKKASEFESEKSFKQAYKYYKKARRIKETKFLNDAVIRCKSHLD